MTDAERGAASEAATSDWNDPDVSDGWTELQAACRHGRGRCQLCGGRVSLNRPHQHRLEATLDHIVPVRQGGGDDRANTQIAHRSCNSRKSARLTKRTAAKAAQLKADHSITLAVKLPTALGVARR